jgi:hypothetical protein
MDLDNDAYFLFSQDYEELYIDNSLKIKGWWKIFHTAKFTEIKALKVKVLKPWLNNTVYDIIVEMKTMKTYKEYLSITNDPTLKKSLTFTYNNVKTQNLENRLQNSIMKTIKAEKRL